MHYNKSGLFMLLATVGASFIWFVWVIYGAASLNLNEVSLPVQGPGSGEALQAFWVSMPPAIARGKKVYHTYCATCHGASGMGDGPAGKALKPPPRNLVEGKWKQGGTSIALYKTLARGVQGTAMVSFSYLPKEDRWALVHYIRSITKKEIKDDLSKLEEFAKKAP